jgi:hypothetical protein
MMKRKGRRRSGNDSLRPPPPTRCRTCTCTCGYISGQHRDAGLARKPGTVIVVPNKARLKRRRRRRYSNSSSSSRRRIPVCAVDIDRFIIPPTRHRLTSPEGTGPPTGIEPIERLEAATTHGTRNPPGVHAAVADGRVHPRLETGLAEDVAAVQDACVAAAHRLSADGAFVASVEGCLQLGF